MQTFNLNLKTIIAAIFATCFAIFGQTAPVQAQNLFKPVVRVNDSAITGYEIAQRVLLLEFLRTPGDLEKLARERLITERLQWDAVSRAGIELTPEQLQAGIEEFAKRANQTGDEFLQTLNDAGISFESFRDFVIVGLTWRELIRAQFGAKARVSEAEIDRALERGFETLENRGNARLRISEIFLRADTPEFKLQSEQIAARLKEIKTIDEFSAAARQISVGPTRDQGGQVEDWVPIDRLPAPIADALMKLNPGGVTDSFALERAIVVFQLREIGDIPASPRSNLNVEYATYYFAGGRSPETLAAANSLRNKIDVCDDLYGIAKGLPPESLQVQTQALSQIPRDIALELARMDPGEVSTNLTRANGQSLMFLMLCNRSDRGATPPTRNEVATRIFNLRLTAFAEQYLAELQADAIIIQQ